jgi:hypothetical protein
MGLLRLAENNPDINYIEYRDIKYWNKYEYRVRFSMTGMRMLWYCDTKEELDRRMGSMKLNKTLTDYIINYDNILSFLEFRTKYTKNKEVSVRIEHSTASVFSNDLSLLKSLETIISGAKFEYTQVKEVGVVGTKFFVNAPKHKYRAYLKTKRISDSELKDLADLVNRATSVFPSKALVSWVNKERPYWYNYNYCSSGYFFDYDDESTLSYLAMMLGELLGNRFKLEKHPKTE